jgi:hypothetical protein
MKSIVAFVAVIVAIVIAAVWFANYVDAESEEYKRERFKNPERFCIDNHVYLVVATSLAAAMAPALNDDGTPVKCKEN